MPTPPPQAILLDVNGTIFPATAAEQTFRDLGIDPSLISLWFTSVLRDATSAQLAGVFVPFEDFAGHHLVSFAAACRAEDAAPPSQMTPAAAAQQLADAWAAAEPFPDVGPGLTQLELAGIRVAALTNSSQHIARSVLRRAGMGCSTSAIFDISEPKAWKPDPNSYRFATNALLLPPGAVMMVASHPWDCHGALQAGLRAAYVQRQPHEAYPPFLKQPDVIVRSFEELADVLLK